MRQPELTGDFSTLMGWADTGARLKVRANADTPEDAMTARRFGAQGIGLCRTEHMFFDAPRIVAVRQMILADASRRPPGRTCKAAADAARRFRGDVQGDGGLPVTIRLLDPPLHEFLPQREEDILEVARAAGSDPAKLRARAIALHESNPMLGHRGCRLGITFPEIYEMQARAIFEAAANVQQAGGRPVELEIMIPLVGFKSELDTLKTRSMPSPLRCAAKAGRFRPIWWAP